MDPSTRDQHHPQDEGDARTSPTGCERHSGCPGAHSPCPAWPFRGPEASLGHQEQPGPAEGSTVRAAPGWHPPQLGRV